MLAVIAAVAVIVGLLIESGPELGRAAVKGVLPSREVQGNVLVTLGVAAETFLGWRALKWARKAEVDAEDRVATAEKLAAEANLERIRLEERMADRRVTAEQHNTLVNELLRVGPMTLDLLVTSSDEAIQFSRQIATAFEMAGWDVNSTVPFPPGGIDPGIVLITLGDLEPHARAIETALCLAGLVERPIGKLGLSAPGRIGLRIGPKPSAARPVTPPQA